MDEIEIRLMQKDDKERVSRFFDTLDDTARRFFDIGGANRRRTMMFFDDSDTDARVRFVAIEGDEMIGYVYLRDTDTMIPWLGIAVSPAARGKHLGTRLMQTAKDWALSHGKGGILLTTHTENLAGQHLYEKSGYTRLGIDGNNGEYLYLLRF